MKLNVSITRVLYPPEAQGGNWFVLLTDQGKCCGSMLWRPDAGERLTLDGRWSAYRGERNFKFSHAYQNVPISPRDQLVYVCERAQGIGPAMMESIWERFGNDWTSVEPGDIPRLTGGRYTAFREAVALLETEAEKSDSIAWLMGKNCTVNMAMTAWEQWKQLTRGVLSTNCYRLADLPHYGFTHVDGSVREAFGIADTDERRIHAAVLYSLGRLTSYGDTVIEWSVLRDDTCKLLGAHYAQMVSDAVTELFDSGALRGFAGTQSIALYADYWDEKCIWEYVTDAA